MDPQLYKAAVAGDVAMLHEILENHSTALHRVSIASNEDTPLHLGALLGHLEFVKEVVALNPALAREPNEQGSSPLHLAAANGHVQVVEELLQLGSDLCLLRDNSGRLPIHVAAMKGRVDVLVKLLSKKPDSIKKVAGGGDTVLHLGVKANRFEVVEFLLERPEVNELLNLKDEKGNTVLHLATARKQIQTTRVLVNCLGVDVNATNKRGATALDVLLESPREHRDVEVENIILAAGGRLGGDPSSLAQIHDPQNVTTTVPIGGEENATNKKGATALDVLSESPREHRDVEVKNSILAACCGRLGGYPSSLPQNHDAQNVTTTRPIGVEKNNQSMWLNDRRNSLMVVATLIATNTFQAAVNPPGGYYQKPDDKQGNSPSPMPSDDYDSHSELEEGNVLIGV